MKTLSRILPLFALLCLLGLLAACGETPSAAPAATEPPAVTAVLPDAALQKADKPSPSPEATPEPDTAARDAAAKYIDRHVEELFKEFGQPKDSSYAPSCLGAGEDGELHYEGFTVYTYKQGDSEVIMDVD